MKIMVYPRDENPYQRLLYGEMIALGSAISFLGELTPVRTLNLLALPLETVWFRLSGARLLHLHWVFAFRFPLAKRVALVRWAGQIWFAAWLGLCRILGVQIVWTAHNALPHERIFADDQSARRRLVDAAGLVIAHSQSTLRQLSEFGAVPERSAVINHGPFPRADPIFWRSPCARELPGRRFLFVGRVREYKGVDDLLAAFCAMPPSLAAHLVVSGACDDLRLRKRLIAIVAGMEDKVTLRLEYLDEDDLAGILRAADVVVLPFRRVTTSGSAILALSHGLPLILPESADIGDMPDGAVIRYDGGIDGLTAAMVEMTLASDERLAAMSGVAAEYISGLSWRPIAERTMQEMAQLLACRSRRLPARRQQV